MIAMSGGLRLLILALEFTQLMRVLMIAALAALIAGSIACSDSPSEPLLEPCPGDTVTMQVSTGRTPLFTWTPSCGIAFLEVYPGPGGSALWTVYGDTDGVDNPISSGVRYGTTPEHGQTVAGPQPLEPGVAYQVRVSRRLCEQGTGCILRHAGSASFQP